MCRVILVLVFVIAGLDQPNDVLPGTDASKKRDPQPKDFEELKPDIAWCGPRVLYFFARYLDRPVTLEEVVAICKTDEQGYTRLDDLVEAARSIGLRPVPLQVPPDEIHKLQGPAVVCVRKAFAPKDKTSSIPEARRHYIGLVGREADIHWIIDPSRDTSLIALPSSRLEKVCTGEVVLLGDADTPALQQDWLRFPLVLLPSTALVCAGYLALRWRLRCNRRLSQNAA